MPGRSDEFPPELLAPAALEQVIAFIRELPIPPAYKRKKLLHWALMNGLSLDPTYYQRLQGGPEVF